MAYPHNISGLVSFFNFRDNSSEDVSPDSTVQTSDMVYPHNISAVLSPMNARDNTSEDVSPDSFSWHPCLSLAVGLVGFLSNILVSVVLKQQLRGKVQAKRYLLSLTLANTIYSASAVLLYVQFRATQDVKISICKPITFLIYFGYYICIQSLTLLAIQQVCAIKLPVYYKRLNSPQSVRKHLVLVWGAGLILTIYPTVNIGVTTTEQSPGTSIECVVLDRQVIRVYHLVFNTALPITVFTSFALTAIVLLKRRSTVSASGSVRYNSVMKRSYIYLVFITTMFFMTFGPYFIFNVLMIVAPWVEHWTTVKSLGNISNLITVLHTWVNPIMHCVCDAPFRKVLLRLICFKSRSIHGTSQARVSVISS